METNKTLSFAVVGHPVAHSQSPRIHQEFAKQFGIQLEYARLDVIPGDFALRATHFFQQGGTGLNVTLPHKVTAWEWIDLPSERAKRAGAVNTIGKNPTGETWGDNTDGAGMLNDLVNNHSIELRNKAILILGAGGAAKGVAFALATQRPKQIAIANRTISRAKDLAELLRNQVQTLALNFDETTKNRWDLIVNATSAGTTKSNLLIPPGAISPATVAYDLQYGDAAKPFVSWATNAGAKEALTGWGMLVEQAALSFELWHGATPNTKLLLEP